LLGGQLADACAQPLDIGAGVLHAMPVARDQETITPSSAVSKIEQVTEATNSGRSLRNGSLED